MIRIALGSAVIHVEVRQSWLMTGLACALQKGIHESIIIEVSKRSTRLKTGVRRARPAEQGEVKEGTISVVE